jgi:hypothetical protein
MRGRDRRRAGPCTRRTRPARSRTFVPVSPRSRMKSASEVRGSTSPACGTPLIRSATLIVVGGAVASIAFAGQRGDERAAVRVRDLACARASAASARGPRAALPRPALRGSDASPCRAARSPRGRARGRRRRPALAKLPCVGAYSANAVRRARGQRRELDRGQQLARRQRGLQRAVKKSRRRARRAGPRRWKRALRRGQRDGSSAFGSACAAEPPTCRATGSRVARVPDRLGEQRPAGPDDRRALERRLAHGRADRERSRRCALSVASSRMRLTSTSRAGLRQRR